MAVRGRVDGMQGRDVTGWALPATGRPACVITVTDEDGTLVATGAASRRREDLAALGAGRIDLAFRLELPGCARRRRFQVFADGEALPGSPLALGPGRYDGDCMVDAGVLKGWVAERIPDPAEPSISIVTQHGMVVGQGQSRRDAKAAWPRAAFEIALQDRCFGLGELRLAVLADGIKFAETGCELSLQGSIDLLTPEGCAGWLVSPDAPERRLQIEIFRNDALVAGASCGNPRQDVRDLYPASAGGGFAAGFPAAAGLEREAVRLSLRLPGADAELFDGPFIVAGREGAVLAARRAARMMRGMAEMGAAEKSVIETALRQFLETARSGTGYVAARQTGIGPQGQTRLGVIIPIYKDVAATRNCIDSVLLHRSAALDRVILIDDASPEPGMATLLDGYLAQPNLFVLRNPENLGFIKTVNRGFGFAGAGDVLLLNSDAIVFPGAFDELHEIAHAADDIATVTAISNDATIFSYPGHHLRAAQLADCEWRDLAEVSLAANAGVAIEVPTGHGFCMLIRGEVLRKLGHFDESFGRGYGEENDFCARAADLGYRHMAAAGVFVQHGGSLSFGDEKPALLAGNLPRLAQRYPEYFPALREFERGDGLRAARWAPDGWRLRKARQGGARFALVISNSLGGGSAKAIADIEQAVGYGGAEKLSLICRADGQIELAAEAPVLRAGFAAHETDALFALLDAAAPGQVLVHQLLGFPPAFLRRLSGWVAARHGVFFLHDFYALCPRVTLLDAAGAFCGVAETDRCERCLALGGAHAESRLPAQAAAHRALFGQLLPAFAQLVAPSAAAAGLLRRGFPGVAVHVIAHPEPGILPVLRQAEDAEEIVLFGALGPHKGAARLLDLARRARLTHPGLSFRVIGHTSLDAPLLAAGNVSITGRYTAAMLPVLAAEARGALALFLHDWPETYSYTLSEALRFGFLPLVPDIGAPAERVRAMAFGIVYPASASAAELLQLIEDVLAGRLRGYGDGVRRQDAAPAPAIAQLRKVMQVAPGPAAKSRAKPGQAGPRRRASACENQPAD